MTLTDAVKFGTIDDVKEALERNAALDVPDEVGCFPLRLAVNGADIRKVKLLLDAGANSRIADKDGNSALCQAVASGRRDMVELLLQYNADVRADCDCGNLIAVATLAGQSELIPFLVSLGVAVDAYNCDGFTPLMLAAGNNKSGVISALLACGAQVNLRDKSHGLTAYLHAAVAGDVIAGQLLMAAGSDVNATDNDGMNAKMLATNNGCQWPLGG